MSNYHYDKGTINVQAPSICPSYQVGTYNVSVYDNHQPIYFVGPNNYTQESIEEPIVIMKEIEAGRQHYQYKITISSEGITHTKMGTIGEYFIIISVLSKYF